MDLLEVRAQLVEQAKETLALVAAGQPMRAIAQEMEELCAVFQAIGICHLLSHLDTHAFRANLLRSVQARVYFLRKSREQGNIADRRLALSRTESHFAALAAGHAGEFRRLKQYSIVAWQPTWEYEEDFLYLAALEALAIHASPSAGAPSIDRYLAMSNPNEDLRLRLLQALQQRDGSAFDDALAQLMRQVNAAQQQRHAELLEPDLRAYLLWPRTFVSIEGLALLALARQRGMQVDGAPPLCPPDGQLAPDETETENFFEGIERILARP